MLARLLAGFASGETVIAVRRARRALVAYVVAALAALCGVGFLIGAFYIWAAGRYGPIEAALWIGGGFVALAIVVVLVHRLADGMRVRRAADRRKADLTAVGIAAALAVLPGLLRGKAGLGVLLAPAIALAAYAIYRENSRPNQRDPDEPPE